MPVTDFCPSEKFSGASVVQTVLRNSRHKSAVTDLLSNSLLANYSCYSGKYAKILRLEAVYFVATI